MKAMVSKRVRRTFLRNVNGLSLLNGRRQIVLFLALSLMVILFVGLFTLHSKASSAEQEGKHKYYTQIRIEYGDTLWSIADRYADPDLYVRSAYIAEVKSINHIQDNNFIQEGKTLIIPYYSSELK